MSDPETLLSCNDVHSGFRIKQFWSIDGVHLGDAGPPWRRVSSASSRPLWCPWSPRLSARAVPAPEDPEGLPHPRGTQDPFVYKVTF